MRLFRPSLFVVPAVLIAAMFLSVATSVSQYLLLDEYEKEEEEAVDPKAQTSEAPTIPSSVARKIKARQLDDFKGIVKVTFDVQGNYSDDFLVGRHTSVIDNRAGALAAETVQIVQGNQTNEVLDFVSASGAYYFMAISKRKISGNEIRLVKDENYTSLPVVITPDEVYYHVRDINSRSFDARKVSLTWQKIARTGLVYRVYRGTRRLDQYEKVKSAVKVGEVTDSGDYIDAGIEIPGIYYYAVTASETRGPERMYPFPDHNYTMLGVKVSGADVNENALFRIHTITAALHEKGVHVKWTYTGSIGGRFYRIFRAKTSLTTSRDVLEDMIISDVDITKKNFTDPMPEAGENYYGILPYGYTEEHTPLVRGMNITDNPVVIEKAKQEKLGKKEEPKVLDKKEKVQEDYGDVESVLHRTFFRGKYDRCVKELQNILPGTDNETDKAKAMLFIGRSYLEMGKYRKALDTLLLEEVNRHFPKESRFWRAQALRKIK
jgi:hypothetical protein